MNVDKKVILSRDMFPFVQDIMSSGKKVRFTVTGNSMLPWIRERKDQVLLANINEASPKKGHIILFKTVDNRYILHRIFKVDSMGFYTIGDNCLKGDGLVKATQIIGVVEKIYRGDKEWDCNALLWKLIFYIWILLLPFRSYLLAFYQLLRKIKAKTIRR